MAVSVVLAGSLVVALGGTATAPPLTLGVTSESATGAAEFAAATGVSAAIQGWYESWAGDTPFDAARADAARAWRIDGSPAAAAAFRTEALVPGRLGAPPVPDRLRSPA